MLSQLAEDNPELMKCIVPFSNHYDSKVNSMAIQLFNCGLVVTNTYDFELMQTKDNQLVVSSWCDSTEQVRPKYVVLDIECSNPLVDFPTPHNSECISWSLHFLDSGNTFVCVD